VTELIGSGAIDMGAKVTCAGVQREPRKLTFPDARSLSRRPWCAAPSSFTRPLCSQLITAIPRSTRSPARLADSPLRALERSVSDERRSLPHELRLTALFSPHLQWTKSVPLHSLRQQGRRGYRSPSIKNQSTPNGCVPSRNPLSLGRGRAALSRRVLKLFRTKTQSKEGRHFQH